MEILEISVSKIDIEKNEVEIIKYDNTNEDDFGKYLRGLIDLVISSNGRLFEFERDTTEVCAQIRRIESDGFTSVSSTIAKRLLSIEKKSQEKMAGNLGTELLKGIIVQALVMINDVNKFIICKADHWDFINEDSLKKQKGLPIKKKVFKSFTCNLVDAKIENILIFDSNLTQYWCKDFLELNEVHSDEYNTETALSEIENGVFSKMKKKHPEDYIYLRNSFVHYFKSRDTFEINDFLDNAVGNYIPVDPSLNVEVDIKSKIRQMDAFDEQFRIIKEKVTARSITTKLQLTKQIDLVIKENIINIENVIILEYSRDGKYVKIRVDESFKIPDKKNN